MSDLERHIASIEAFQAVDVGRLTGSVALAQCLRDVGDALWHIVDAQIAVQGEKLGNTDLQSASTIERTLGFGERQTFQAVCFALDYGTNISLTRISANDAKMRSAYIAVPLTWRLKEYLKEGRMSFGGFFAMIDDRKYSPFNSTEPLASKIYASLLQRLLPPVIDPDRLGYPLVWQSPIT
jgi:hypothetical protein